MKTLCIISSLFICSFQTFAQVDLHAHLDLKPGSGLILGGNFSEPPHSPDWKSRLRTKASSTSLSLMQSPKIIVVSLYAHPFFSKLFSFDLHGNIQAALEEEYSHLLVFAETHSKDWAIAKTPAEARAALSENKNVMVLSIEGAADTVDTEADFKKWIVDRGVAIITPFHLTSDDLGGSAFMPNLIAIFNAPFGFFKSAFQSKGSCIFDFCKSPEGMSKTGEALIRNLWKHQVWIDLAHANEKEVESLLPEMTARKLPLLVTHTQVREVYPAERALDAKEARYLGEFDGMIGLVPSGDMMPAELQEKDATECSSTLTKFKQVMQFARKQYGELKVTLGSDINAPLIGLSPICKANAGQALSDLEQRGFYQYSQINELAQYISDSPDLNARIVNHFLELWEQARERAR